MGASRLTERGWAVSEALQMVSDLPSFATRTTTRLPPANPADARIRVVPASSQRLEGEVRIGDV
jgi:hypothetical protein